MLRSLALRVLIALALGLGAGAACGAIGNEGLTAAAGMVEAVEIQMDVVKRLLG